MTEEQRLMTRRRGTWKTAWNTLNKAHTLLASDPATRALAANVFATMLKLDAVIDRQPGKTKSAHATRARGSNKEVTYRGFTYNLRSAYDRGYYDALRGSREQEQSADYATGYSSGLRAPHTRR